MKQHFVRRMLGSLHDDDIISYVLSPQTHVGGLPSRLMDFQAVDCQVQLGHVCSDSTSCCAPFAFVLPSFCLSRPKYSRMRPKPLSKDKRPQPLKSKAQKNTPEALASVRRANIRASSICSNSVLQVLWYQAYETSKATWTWMVWSC